MTTDVPPESTPKMSRALLPLLAITFVDVLGFTMLIPILPFYAEHFGASPSTIAAIYSTVAVCSLISSPFWGRLSDRIGRRGVLMAAQVAAFLGFVLLAFSGSLWMVFVARGIEGLGGGGLGVTQAYVTDVTTPQNRARAFGMVGATFGLGFLIGPAVAGFLTVRFGYAVPFAVAAGLAFATILMTAFMLPESKGAVATAPSLREIGDSLTSPRLGRLLLTQFAFAIAFTSWVGVFALFAERVLGYGPGQTSLVFMLSAIVSIVVQTAAIGRLVDRFGEGRIALFGLACGIVAYAGVGFVHATIALYAFVVLWSVSGALIRPTLGALISEAAPPSQRGSILSVNDSLNNVAFALAPAAAALVLTRDAHLTGIVPAAFGVVAVLLGYRLLRAAPAARAEAA